MNRFQAADARNYVGSVSHSMEHLPKWFQIVALSGILCVIYLRNNPIVSWLAVNLHSSFGTEVVWYHHYQALLEQMSFNERLGFTLYGVALGGAVLLLYKVFCRESYGLGLSASQLFPDRRGWFVVMFVVLCLVEVVRMRAMIAQCIGEKGSLANIAINEFEGLIEHGYDARLASRNVHYLVQVEVLKALAKSFVFERLPIVVATGLFRVARDIPRRTHAGLRWYMATGAVVAAITEAISMYLSQTYDNASAWATIAWAAAFLGAVNYIYGPSKRAGMVVTVTSVNSFSEAMRAVTTCTALWNIASLLVLTTVVSVHVVELIGLWLIMTLLTVWVPAVIDSCSTDYIVLLTGVFAYLGHAMGYLTARGSVRFGALLVVWWMAACLVYNVAMNVSHTRYGGILVVLWFFCWIISPGGDMIEAADAHAATSATGSLLNAATASADAGADVVAEAHAALRRGVLASDTTTTTGDSAEPAPELATFLKARVRWMCEVADYDASGEHRQRRWGPFSKLASGAAPHTLATGSSSTAAKHAADVRAAEVGRATFSRAVTAAVLICAVAILLNHLYSRRVSREMRLKMRRASVVLVTPKVLCRKAVHTVVLVFCVLNFILSSWAFRTYALPHIVHYLPDFVSRGISVSVGCTVLGVLMDTKESMYDAVARIIGLIDPPRLNDDGTIANDGTSGRSTYESEESATGESEGE